MNQQTRAKTETNNKRLANEMGNLNKRLIAVEKVRILC